MKTVGYIILGLLLFKMLSQQQTAAAAAPATSAGGFASLLHNIFGGAVAPSDVSQQIANQNAAFWASVGAPFDTSTVNGQTVITAPPQFAPGVSATPYDPTLVEGT